MTTPRYAALGRMAALWMVALAALALAGGAALLAGCGSGATATTGAAASTTGRATITITWPALPTNAKLIPAASNSIVATFLQNDVETASQTVARPTSGGTTTMSFDSLPPGNLTVVAAAYPTTDGSGVAQASATLVIPIVSGKITGVGMTMASTIDHLTINPITPTVTIGSTASITMTAYDIGNNVVLVAPGNVSWTSLTPSIVTVDQDGTLTGVALGTAQVQVTESESGKVGTAEVTVAPPVSISISPTATTVGVLESATFTATVNGPTDTSVSWSVLEGATGGVVSSSGVYTAPATAGVYHVVATSNADATKSAKATVTVPAGSSTVTVN